MFFEHYYTMKTDRLFGRRLSFGTQIGKPDHHVQRGSRIKVSAKPPGHFNSTHHYIHQEEK